MSAQTLGDLWDEQFPKANRFVVCFQSSHLLDNGGRAYQNQRRFCLATDTNDAREFFRLGELADAKRWDGHFHQWSNLSVGRADDYDPYPGYFRFGTETPSYRAQIQAA